MKTMMRSIVGSLLCLVGLHDYHPVRGVPYKYTCDRCGKIHYDHYPYQ